MVTLRAMIKSFKHKGLEDFFYAGTLKGIQAKHALKLGDILDRLESAQRIVDMERPGSRLHSLKGKMKGLWSVRVSGNWRVVFRFEDGDAHVVNYLDYH